jgi:predicted aminopeptidase
MEDTIKFEMTKSEAEQLSAILTEVIEAMDQAQARMAKDQEEIDRLRAETREILQRDWRGGVNVEAILGPVSSGFDFNRNYRSKQS